MPEPTLAQTPTAGRAEVLKALQFLHANPERKGWTPQRIAEALQPLQRLRERGEDIVGEITTVLGLLEADNPPTVQSYVSNGTTVYKLTDQGVLAARRARPIALRP